MLSKPGAALTTRFDSTGDVADLDAAITPEREAINATQPITRTVHVLSNLGESRDGRVQGVQAVGAPVLPNDPARRVVQAVIAH